MPVNCTSGCGKRAILKRPKTGDALCKECFFFAFEEEVHHTITSAKLFSPGEYVAIAASGGKDSTVLAHLMTLLNKRYQYGLKLVLLSIDEGIAGYRDDSLETVKRNELQYGIPLKILSYEELYGWTMDKIVQKVGRRNNCTFCGVFRRQALDRGAQMLGVHKLVTGHNADDIAETIVMNILRGDVARLQRCCAVETGSEGHLPRSKPFKYTYEKEIVMYAYFKKLDYFSTECIYSPNAYRGHARAYIKDLEKIRPTAIIDIIHSGECLLVKEGVRLPSQTVCGRCGHVSSQAVCKACVLLEGLNKGKPRLGVGKSSKVKQKMNQNPNDLVGENVDTEKEMNRCPEDSSTPGKYCTGTTEESDDAVTHVSDTIKSADQIQLTNVGISSHSSNTGVRKSALPAISRTETETKIDSFKGASSSSQTTGDISENANSNSSSSMQSKSESSTSLMEASKPCRSQLTSIEDIGNTSNGSLCASGGSCSGDCKNKDKKKRKVVSLRSNPDLILKAVGISKKDLDF